MGSSERDLHTGLECHTVHRRRYLAYTTARFLYDLASTVGSRFLISLFRRALPYNLIKGKFLTRPHDGSVDSSGRKLYVCISLLVGGRLRRKRRKSLILLLRVRCGKLRLALIDLSLYHGVIVSACRSLHEVLYKLLLVHSLARSSVRKQELIRRSVILGDRAVLCLHIPLRRRVRCCLCRCGLQIFRIFHRECIFSAILVSRNPVQKGIQLGVDHIVRVHTLPVVRDLHIPRKLRLDGSFRLALCHSL